jgi:hypothetical protein
MLSKQLGGLLWGRYFSNPVNELILMVAKLVFGVVGFPYLAVREDE